MTKLTDPWAPTAAVVCDFGWHTQDGSLFPTLSYRVNGVQYPPANWTWTSGGVTYSSQYTVYTTVLGQTIIFDAIDALSLGLPKTIVPAGVQIVSYNWDLGNGQSGIGPTVSTVYNYTSPPPDAAVTLTVTDSLGRRASTTHLINLQALTQLSGSMNTQRQGTART